MIILYDNKLDNATLTASSENAAYPADNVKDLQLVKVWRTTGDSSEYLEIDLGDSYTIEGIAIANHNLSSGSTTKIQAILTGDTWGDTKQIDDTLTYDSDIIIDSNTEYTSKYRHWRFTFGDTNNSDTYLQIGRIYLGGRLAIDNCAVSFVEKYEDTSAISTSITGQVYGDEGVLIRKYDCAFPRWDDSRKAEIVAMINTVKRTKPIFLVFDESNVDKITPVYVVIENSMDYSHIFNYRWSSSIKFREVK